MRLRRRACLVLLCAAILASPGPARAAEAIASPPPPEAPARLRFLVEPQVPRSAEAVPVAGEIRLRARERASEPVVSIPLPLPPDPTPVELAARVGWDLTVHVPGFWSPGRILGPLAPGSESTEPVPLWPAGRIAGTLVRSDPREPLPTQLGIRLTRPPLAEPVRSFPVSTVVDCELRPDGAFDCPAPAGSFDLAVQAQGFVPDYLWGRTVAAGRTLVLPRLTPRRGSSVAGYVRVEGGRIDPDRCLARLAPADAPGNRSVTGQRITAAVQEARVRADGFFQLAGVAPGTYSLEVVQPGFGPALVRPLAVWPGAETFLREPVELSRPLDLELRLVPPVDWLGKRWAVEVLRLLPGGAGPERPALAGSAPESGVVVLSGQTPGRFVLKVRDSVGSVLLGQDFGVSGPAEAAQTFEIPLVAVEGTVTFGGEPVAAEVYFGTRFGRERARLEAGRDGRFEGVLGRAGRWLVEVEVADPPLATRLWAEVEPGPDGVARVELEIPSTRVIGRVLAPHASALELGPALGRTRVSLSAAPAVNLSARVEADGRFELRGVPEGPVSVSAKLSFGDRRYSSPSQLLVVEKDRDAGPVELRLAAGRTVRGRVQGPRGPIPGARVDVLPWPPMDRGGSAQTDWEGGFEIEVGALGSQAAVSVMAPGHALKSFLAPLDGAPWVLNVPAEGGTLVLALPTEAEERPAEVPSYWHGEAPVFVNHIGAWREGHGIYGDWQGDLVVPEMAAGEYRLCTGPPATASRPDARTRVADLSCERGTLLPGGVLRLKAPELPASSGD